MHGDGFELMTPLSSLGKRRVLVQFYYPQYKQKFAISFFGSEMTPPPFGTFPKSHASGFPKFGNLISTLVQNSATVLIGYKLEHYGSIPLQSFCLSPMKMMMVVVGLLHDGKNGDKPLR